jgi:hypothetical protein
MKINKNHLYHGAAIAQVVEHDKFTSIKTFEQNGTYEINGNAILALKYAKEPKGNSYQFVFQRKTSETFIILEKKKKIYFSDWFVSRVAKFVAYHINCFAT